MREAERAVSLLPASKDPVFGPGMEEALAAVEAQVGESERAITRIERLLTTPYGAFPLSQASLRLDPTWDPLRQHPRFKAHRRRPGTENNLSVTAVVNPWNFLAELKRRNVYRAAVAYGAVSWLLIQISTQVFPFFEIPNSTVRFVVVALVLGFPIAMLVAWLYELTPEGFVREEEVDPAKRKGLGRKMDFVIIGVLLLVIAMLIYERRPFRSVIGETIPQKSIAVLPFENLSDDKANAFFADGIQDDILTNLTKIRDLRVISRTSTEHYRGKKGAGSLREIAKALGAANVLEGSVRREGNRVAVNVQLIDALQDRHLWAQRYDRTLEDSLGMEGELAREIADALSATLTPEEKARVERKPTANADAWLLYLRGRCGGHPRHNGPGPAPPWTSRRRRDGAARTGHRVTGSSAPRRSCRAGSASPPRRR